MYAKALKADTTKLYPYGIHTTDNLHSKLTCVSVRTYTYHIPYPDAKIQVHVTGEIFPRCTIRINYQKLQA